MADTATGTRAGDCLWSVQMITRAFTATLIVLFAALFTIPVPFIGKNPQSILGGPRAQHIGWVVLHRHKHRIPTFKMVLDTDSRDIWVGSVPCSNPCSSLVPLYNPSASSTAVNVSTTLMKIAENGESVSGSRFSDRIHLGQYSISNSIFLVSQTINPTLVPTVCSGSFGIAFVGVSQTSTNLFFQVKRILFCE
ncbi:aspartic peptidase domain-containing protein [Mycena olivaceomarginata]|nr:aspartic peptidase domain-containing protein [Mycena olivaceomarginata]